MYFACVFLFIIGFISFALTIVLSALAPNVSQICHYVDTKLSTGAGTSAFFSRLGFNQLGDFLSNCMADGTGWAMDKIGPTFNTSFSNLLLISQNTQLFNALIPDYSTTNLTAPFTSASTTVNKVLNAQLLDINDNISLTHISKVQNVVYPIDIACTVLNVQGDSWMPSYDLYTCPGGKAQNPPCLNLSKLSTCPLGCYEIMKEFESASGDSSYATSLANRYGSTTCNYYNYIKNLETSWNIPRKTSMNAVLADLTTLQSKINDYDTTFKATQANVSSYSSILQTNFNGLTNLTVGTFNGLDCRVIGESVIDMRNSICVGVLNSIYYNLICLILVSYGTLLAACCTVCAGVRHFRHLQKMQIHVGYKGVPVSITDTSKLFEKWMISYVVDYRIQSSYILVW